MRVPHNSLIAVADGRKLLFLRNEGDADLLNLRRASVTEQANPATRDQGSDAPGQGFAPSGTRQGSLGETDYHAIEEERFADVLAADLNKGALAQAYKELVVVAPPKILAELRREFSKHTQERIAAEIPKDLVHHTIPEIEKLLAAQDV